jgi:TrmH family RNA methyltransferase
LPLSKLDNLAVVLVRPRNPLNIGAVARAMSNFGVSRLRLVNPYAVAFLEAVSAVGAQDLLKSAEEFITVAEAVADCKWVVGTTAARNRIVQHPLRRLDQAGTTMHGQLKAGRVALLFGSEKTGLSNDDFNHCHWLLHVPTQEKNVSMNLAQAVAVCLYEFARDGTPEIATPKQKTKTKTETETELHAKGKLDPSGGRRAAAGDNEQIIRTLFEALRISGYVKPGTDSVMEKKARRLILRLGLEEMDAKVLLGMMRQIAWKLRHEK